MTDIISTHADDCWSWGHGHYECAVREIERLRAEVERLSDAVQGWWKARRPVGWTEDQHRSCPHVNLVTGAEKRWPTPCSRGLEKTWNRRHEGEQNMNIEQERTEFEAWYRRHHGSLDVYGRDAFGEYVDKQVQGAFNVWQARAARAAQTADDARDAARYRWLRDRMIGIDFDWAEAGITALSFEMPDGMAYGCDCDRNIDAAMQRTTGRDGEQ